MAIRSMPDDFGIKGFVSKHKAEVEGMLDTEYNEAEVKELFKEEGRAEGRAEERVNTERERKRADAAEARVKALEAQLAARA